MFLWQTLRFLRCYYLPCFGDLFLSGLMLSQCTTFSPRYYITDIIVIIVIKLHSDNVIKLAQFMACDACVTVIPFSQIFLFIYQRR